MFIYIAYKDSPELGPFKRLSAEEDLSIEKTLVVNPKCPVRVMLEYIRNKCCLGKHTDFDLCDENGFMKGLFQMPTYVHATDQFEHKKTYYVVVISRNGDRKISVLPQINRENAIYEEMKEKIKKNMSVEDMSVQTKTPSPTTPNKSTAKVTPSASKPTIKRK